MIAVRSPAVGAAWQVSESSQGGPQAGRGRWQDKRPGTYRVHVLDGVGEFPGPPLSARAYRVEFTYKNNILSGTLRFEPRHGG